MGFYISMRAFSYISPFSIGMGLRSLALRAGEAPLSTLVDPSGPGGWTFIVHGPAEAVCDTCRLQTCRLADFMSYYHYRN